MNDGISHLPTGAIFCPSTASISVKPNAGHVRQWKLLPFGRSLKMSSAVKSYLEEPMIYAYNDP